MKYLSKSSTINNSCVKFIIAALISTLPAIAFSQTATVDHIAICVKDLKKSTAFYTQVMHLQKVDNPFADTVHQWYNIGNNIKMHAIQGSCTTSHQKSDHLCFAVASVAEFAKNLKKLNIPYSNWKGDSDQPTLRADGVLQLYFQDPDGYWIEINSPGK
jgi:lactoylglutathione lyase